MMTNANLTNDLQICGDVDKIDQSLFWEIYSYDLDTQMVENMINNKYQKYVTCTEVK